MFRAELLVANEYVFTADEPGKDLYIIHAGRVEVSLMPVPIPSPKDPPSTMVSALIASVRLARAPKQNIHLDFPVPKKDLAYVQVITPEGIVVGRLSDGAYFGEIAILVDVRRTSSVRTACRCHFYKLSKEDFSDVLSSFPELKVRAVLQFQTEKCMVLPAAGSNRATRRGSRSWL